ncbi:MAG: ribonuclease HII [Candidatus Nanosyncoccus sp. P13S_S20_bin.18.1]|nr:ribonuclease HII [Candidatus Nanosyncoccus sp. P13S_S20_bin.18.1]
MILGIDEVGRGPYAGPLVIGACILGDWQNSENTEWIEKLTDSKKLSAKRRDELYVLIKEKALAAATGWVSSVEIDEIGLSEALRLATRRAVEQIQKTKVPFSEIIIDGTMNFLAGTKLEKYVSTLKKGDFLVKEISAASILAKVERDKYMAELDAVYPEYGFGKHVGYGTAVHQKAMEEFGLTPEHRRSFRPVREIAEGKTTAKPKNATRLKTTAEPKNASEHKITNKQKTTTKQLGDQGEQVVVDYLEVSGHEIMARNYKTKLFEVDIISRKNEMLYFTEVKYRSVHDFGAGLDFIDKKKQEKMRLAVAGFLATHPEYADLTPILAVAAVEKDFKLEEWFELDE